MRRYKLYLNGVSYMDDEGNTYDYRITTSRDSKKHARDYGKDATVTDMHDHILSRANLNCMGKPYNVVFDRDEYITKKWKIV